MRSFLVGLKNELIQKESLKSLVQHLKFVIAKWFLYFSYKNTALYIFLPKQQWIHDRDTLSNPWLLLWICVWGPHTVRKWIYIGHKLPRTFDSILLMYDINAYKKCLKNLFWTKKKNHVPQLGLEPTTPTITQNQGILDLNAITTGLPRISVYLFSLKWAQDEPLEISKSA